MNTEAIKLFFKQHDDSYVFMGLYVAGGLRVAYATDSCSAALQFLADGDTPTFPSVKGSKPLTDANVRTALGWGGDAESVTVCAAALGIWLEAPNWNRALGALGSCRNCCGDGVVPCTCDCGHMHDADCDECDGKGKTLPRHEMAHGLARGFAFDRNRIAQTLAMVGFDGDHGGDVEVRIHPNAHHPGTALMRLDGPGWRVTVQGVKNPASAGPSLVLPEPADRPVEATGHV